MARRALAALVAALGWCLVASALYAQEIVRCPDRLPQAVAQKRDAIIAAARARDYAALQKLISAREFVYSFGEGEKPIAYWRAAAKDGIDIPKLMVAVFEMRCTFIKAADGSQAYSWPSAAEIEWAKLNPAERAALEKLYGKKIDEYWIEGRAKGYYVGWRGTIDAKGEWQSFVAGD